MWGLYQGRFCRHCNAKCDEERWLRDQNLIWPVDVMRHFCCLNFFGCARIMKYKASCPNCGKKMPRRYIFCEPTIYHRCRECGVDFRPTVAGYISTLAFLGFFIFLFLLPRMHLASPGITLVLVLLTFVAWIWVSPYTLPVQSRPEKPKERDGKPTD